MKTGIAPYSPSRRLFTTGISSSGTSKPGQPYQRKVVDLDRPLNPLTRPPDDMEKSYLPSSERWMVIGSRFETRRSLAFSSLGLSGAGIMAGQLRRAALWRHATGFSPALSKDDEPVKFPGEKAAEELGNKAAVTVVLA
jgi:hypothetical protein